MKGILTQTYSVSHSHITSPKPVQILTPLRRMYIKRLTLVRSRRGPSWRSCCTAGGRPALAGTCRGALSSPRLIALPETI